MVMLQVNFVDQALSSHPNTENFQTIIAGSMQGCSIGIYKLDSTTIEVFECLLYQKAAIYSLPAQVYYPIFLFQYDLQSKTKEILRNKVYLPL